MHNLRHFYYQNKEKIWKVVLIIAFLLGLIYYTNYSLGKQNNAYISTSENERVNYSNEKEKIYVSEESAIYGNKLTDGEAKKINNVISDFLKYCREGNVKEAYDMLSTDCKSNQYATLEKFQNKYVNLKFDKYDIFEITKWINDTYKVTISKDMLATGDISINNQIEYITVVDEDSIEKLNINSYIEKKEINRETTVKDIKISVLSKRVYMDYEEYEFLVENLSNKTIKLDSMRNADTMYLKSSLEGQYSAYAHELYEEDLEIKSKHKSNFSIKYAKPYSNDNSIEQIIFNNVILDYPEYISYGNDDKKEYIIEIAIDL